MRVEPTIDKNARNVASKFDEILYEAIPEYKNYDLGKRRYMSGQILSKLFDELDGKDLNQIIEGFKNIH